MSKGAGLARGPAAGIGLALLAFGLAALVNHNDFPRVTDAFPDGNATGDTFFGIEVNGWTCWLAAAAGALLLFGSAQHLIAKFTSLAVGMTLAGAALLGLVNGDVLGLAATNTATVIGLAGAAGVLLLNVFSPRVGRSAEPVPPAPVVVTVPATATAAVAPAEAVTAVQQPARNGSHPEPVASN